MKKVIAIILVCLTLYATALAEPGKGGKSGGMDMLNEGIAYLNGDGVEQDYERAMQIFQSAQEAGNKNAARYIGLMLEQGLGVEQDYEAAATWYAQGVEAGDLTSGYYLGLLYKQGLGVEQDYAKAAELFASVAGSDNKSATGVVAAGYELGQLYEQGLGVEQDMEKAIALYEEAAEYGDEDSVAALERVQTAR